MSSEGIPVFIQDTCVHDQWDLPDWASFNGIAFTNDKLKEFASKVIFAFCMSEYMNPKLIEVRLEQFLKSEELKELLGKES